MTDQSNKCFVMQDGADFYIYADDDYESLICTVTAPFKVLDFDMESAKKARRWFDESNHLSEAENALASLDGIAQ